MAKKPMGRTGGVRLSIGPDGSTIDHLDRQFSGTKDVDETLIAKEFVRSANKLLPFKNRFRRLTKNAENDLDFSAKIDNRRVFIELMEYRPWQGPYPKGDVTRDIHQETLWLREKIERKDMRQGPGLDRHLFLYSTHETYSLHEDAAIAALQELRPGFTSIWYGHFLGQDFRTTIVYPRPDLPIIDLEKFRGRIVHSFSSHTAEVIKTDTSIIMQHRIPPTWK